MFNFNKKTEVDVMSSIGTAMDSAPLSEEMIRRDNFFHNCWMYLKSERPDLVQDMATAELHISGYIKTEETDKEDEKLDPVL